MAGARAAAAASAGSTASSGSPQPQEPGLWELLEEFSRTQYRAKDSGGKSGSKVERIEKRCLELFGRDYCFSVIPNVNGDICGHYPRHIVFLEYESSEKEKDTNRVSLCSPGFPGTHSVDQAVLELRNPPASATSAGVKGMCHHCQQFQSTVQVNKLQDLIHRSKMARCRGRFVCPVILFKGKHICRSATLAGWGELYGRSGYNYFFSGGADDTWANTEDVTEEDFVLRSGDTHLFDKVRGYDIKLLQYLSVKYICDLMVENKKVKFGMNVTSSEKVDKAQRYANFTLLSIPYPGCEFFKEYKDRDYMAEGLIFNWKQDYVDAPLNIPNFLTQSLNIDWSQYQSWDLVQQTQNYLKLLLFIINRDGDGLIHTSLKPAEILYLTVAYDWFLFGHMLVDRLSKGEEIFFFCFNFLKHITSEEFCLKTQSLVIYTVEQNSAQPGQQYVRQLRKSLPTRDAGFTVEDICMLRHRDRGSTTSLGSDFSLVLEHSPGAVGSFSYETVELVPAGAPTQAAWRKSHSPSPQSMLWIRPQPSEDRLPSHHGLSEAKSSSSSSSNHSDTFFRMGSSPLEVPKPRSEAQLDARLPEEQMNLAEGHHSLALLTLVKEPRALGWSLAKAGEESVDHPLPGSSLSTDFGSWQMVSGCGSIQERPVLHTDSSLPFSFQDELPNSCLLTALSDRETRLQEVRSAFLAAYSSTVGLRAAAPSPSGAIGGLLEQFARGVGLRGTSTSAL
ncbi:Myotubularin-related protein 14 [Apodemus speciosus]|uniref:Myotubularin-related protein 14 n=1 Tax=Apodemus speciosus TaxID=105296 RepID=A0ABQ0EW58_APOSI